MNVSKRDIIDYAARHKRFSLSQIADDYGMNHNTARQYLSILAKENKLVRIG